MIVFKNRTTRGKQEQPDSACKMETKWMKNKINPIKIKIFNLRICMESMSRVLKMQVIMDPLINQHFIIKLIMIIKEVENQNREKKDLLLQKHLIKLNITLKGTTKDLKDLGLNFYPKNNIMI